MRRTALINEPEKMRDLKDRGHTKKSLEYQWRSDRNDSKVAKNEIEKWLIDRHANTINGGFIMQQFWLCKNIYTTVPASHTLIIQVDSRKNQEVLRNRTS
jgi:hypothetical protein